MDTITHNLSGLFAQLGLPNSSDEIADFIDRNRPVAKNRAIYELDIFTRSQKQFLHEGLQQDAEWAEVIDELHALLRHES